MWLYFLKENKISWRSIKKSMPIILTEIIFIIDKGLRCGEDQTISLADFRLWARRKKLNESYLLLKLPHHDLGVNYQIESKKITHSNLTNIRVITYTITFVRKDVVSQYLVYLVVNIEKINFKLQLKAFEKFIVCFIEY